MQLQEIIESLRALPEEERLQIVQEAVDATKDLKWLANPGPQQRAVDCEADELYFGGGAGGGKSSLIIGLALTQHRRSLILREFNKDAVALGEELLKMAGSSDGWNGQTLRYRAHDKLIEFAGIPNEKDKERHKGVARDLICFDELGDVFESQYTFIIGWCRSTIPGQRCRVVSTGNPPTRAKGLWVIKRWAAWLDPAHPNPAKDGELRWYTTGEEGIEIEVDGRGPHLIGGQMIEAKSRTFIRARLEDNPDLANTGYESTLAAMPAELRAAYRDGKFDASLKDHPFQLIPTAWILEAQKRWSPQIPYGIPMCAMAADPGGGGRDNTTVASRHDGWFAPILVIPSKLTPLGRDVAGLIVANRRNEAAVCVDMGGGYGGAPYQTLIENGIEPRAYKGAEKTSRRTADGKLGFTNLRTAVHWRFREALDPSQPGGSPIALPPNPRMVAGLTALTFEVTPHGIKALSKEEVCDRLGFSPDESDAVVMCYDTGPRHVGYSSDYGPDQRPGHTRFPKIDLGPRRRGLALRR